MSGFRLKLAAPSKELNGQILDFCRQISKNASSYGCPIAPYKNPELVLDSLTDYKKQTLHASLRDFAVIMPKSNLERIKSEEENLRSALNYYDLELYDEEFFSYITPTDVIEIHTTEGLQIYRNFEMFKYCTYSLLELVSSPWTELYLRPQVVIDGIMGQVLELMDRPELGTVRCRYPHHVLTERSHSPYTIGMEFKYLSAVLSVDTGFPIGVVTSKTCKLLASEKEENNLLFI